MFTKLNNGNALCVEAYQDVQKKAIVPPVNELWEQVEEYTSAHGWHEMTEQEIAEFLKSEPTPNGEHGWVKSELKSVDLQLKLHWTADPRAKHTVDAWSGYARALRDYTSTETDGNPIVVGESRPSIDDFIEVK